MIPTTRNKAIKKQKKNEQYLTTLLSKPGFICFVVIVSNEAAGGLKAYELPLYYSDQCKN